MSQNAGKSSSLYRSSTSIGVSRGRSHSGNQAEILQYSNGPGKFWPDRLHHDRQYLHQRPRRCHPRLAQPAHENFAAAEHKKEDARLGQLVEDVLDFLRGHLAFVVVVEITMNAALVAAIGDVDMHAERDAKRVRFFVHLSEQTHCAPVLESEIGWSEASRIRCCESALTNSSAS